MKRSLKLNVLALLLVTLLASIAAACPTCGEGIGQADPHGQSLARGLYYSIIFMMSMPFLIVGTLGCAAYISIRRARLSNAESTDRAPGEAQSGPQNA
jgi:heme/copper-type cytochrome/quinol oxidase subunit 2